MTLVLFVGISPVQAKVKAAPKATGSVEYAALGYFLDFNAHEAIENRPAKGEIWAYIKLIVLDA